MNEVSQPDARFLQTIVENTAAAIYVVDRNGRFLFVNRHWESLFHRTRTETVGKTLHDIFPDATADALLQSNQAILAAGQSAEVTEFFPQADGLHTYLSLKFPLVGPDGAPYAICCISTDITERWRAENALRDSEERFRFTFDQSPLGSAIVSLDFRYLRVNPALCRITGYTQAELMALSFADVTHPDDLEADLAQAQRLVAGEIDQYDLQERYLHKDGQVVWVHLWVRLVRDAAGQPLYALSLVEDITRRRQAEAERDRLTAEAQHQAAQLQAILDNMVDGVIVVDAAGRLTLFNQAGGRMAGLEPEDIGHPVGKLFRGIQAQAHDGTPISPAEMPLLRSLSGETVRDFNYVVSRPPAREGVYLRVSTSPVRDQEGSIVGAVSVLRDVTELIELERMKEQFIAVAAHELRTPVTIMKGSAQILLRTAQDLGASQRRLLQSIDRGADRIDHIVRDLLDITRLHTKPFQIAGERVNLSEVVQSVADQMALTTGRTFKVIALEPARVLGDASRLEQVLANLLDNAARYSPQGGDIEVSLTQRNGEAVVSVRDYGVGIPKEKQKHIFERFYRAHTMTPYDYGGLGVGLYISHQIVQRHGGRMWFESEEGKGSTFSFAIPLAV